MTSPRPVRIVTLPGRSIVDLREQMRAGLAAGAEMAEVRVDRLPAEERRRLGALFPAPLPLLATYRSRAEGGDGSDDPGERHGRLTELAALPFEAIDREVVRDPPVPGAHRAVASVHLAGLDAGELHRRLAGPPDGSWFAKVVAPATVSEALDQVIPALPEPGESSFVAHTTGPSGALLRALADRLGMAAVFCALPRRPLAPEPVEPAQIPVDRIRRLQEGSASPRRFAVLGTPIAHSRSPAVHSRWYAAEGRRAIYVALQIDTEADLATAVAGLAAAGFEGVNVTRPWKAAALALATEASRGASRCGCANTLAFEGETVRAENTDLVAALRRLAELRVEGRWDGERLTVLGTGGAARAFLAAAGALGARAIVVGRRRGSAETLAREFGAEASDWSEPRPAGLLVNATPVGLPSGGPFPGALSGWIAAGGFLLDLVYAAEEPLVARTAEAAGAAYEDGWRLLVYQAAESHQIWWGTPPPEDSVQELLREGPCEA